MMDLKQILTEWLKSKGFVGLACTETEECFCFLDDLMPCNHPEINRFAISSDWFVDGS